MGNMCGQSIRTTHFVYFGVRGAAARGREERREGGEEEVDTCGFLGPPDSFSDFVAALRSWPRPADVARARTTGQPPDRYSLCRKVSHTFEGFAITFHWQLRRRKLLDSRIIFFTK